MATSTSILCAFGRHSPAPIARWNSGYYFTKCARCGQDLVRTAYGRWHRPRGYRVVWQPLAPAGAISAALVAEPAPASPTPATELPIQEVIRHVQEADLAGEAPSAMPAEGGDELSVTGALSAEPPRPSEDQGPPASRHTDDSRPLLLTGAIPARGIGDFMKDEPGDVAWGVASRRYLLRGPSSQQKHNDDSPPPTSPRAQLFGRFRERLARARVAFLRVRGERGVPTTTALPAEWWNRRPDLRLVVPIGLGLIAFSAWAGWQVGARGRVIDRAAHAAPIVGEGSQPAFVTASVLNCHSSPAREAQTVAVLSRGNSVRLLARDGEWVSLAREGGQCWVLARYVSAARPI